jgi:hypothetical protein
MARLWAWRTIVAQSTKEVPMNAINTTRRRITRSLGAALLVGVCAIATPAAASASPNLGPVIADTGRGAASGQPQAPPAPPTGLVDRHPQQTVSTPGGSTAPSLSDSTDPSPGYSSPTAITGASVDEPTFVSSSPSSGDRFDWADAALGAGAALALVALGGIALLTLRRRTAISPSVSTG